MPEHQPTVKVEGAVNSPVAVAYRERAGVSYYVDAAGGFTDRADRKPMHVAQPNGAVQRRSGRQERGSRIFVPEIPETQQKMDWAGIVGGVASVLTSALMIILAVQRL